MSQLYKLCNKNSIQNVFFLLEKYNNSQISMSKINESSWLISHFQFASSDVII